MKISSRRVGEIGLYMKVDLHSYLPINPQKQYLLTKKVKRDKRLEVPFNL